MAITCIEREFIPVVLGGDINAYSVARAFFEEYQVATYVFGKFPGGGPNSNSRIVRYQGISDIEDPACMLKTVNGFATAHADKTIILMGASDGYVALAAEHRDELAANIVFPYADFKLMSMLQNKDRFYELCERYGIGYPRTLVHSKGMGTDFDLEFTYPVILKASNSTLWWEAPFAGQEKVHKVESREELNALIGKIYAAGYADTLVIQDMIPGNDENMRVLTCYSDKNAQVKMMCLGHTLLEEHAPTARGNHALVITEPNDELMMPVKRMLEDLGYVGFSNFDIKYDERDGQFKFFEINTRQGRSNYYVTGSGFNIARYVVEEYVYGREAEFAMAREPHLWTVVPKCVAFKYVQSPESRALMSQLYREGKVVVPSLMKGDLAPKRLYNVMRTYLGHIVKFKKYYHGTAC